MAFTLQEKSALQSAYSLLLGVHAARERDALASHDCGDVNHSLQALEQAFPFLADPRLPEAAPVAETAPAENPAEVPVSCVKRMEASADALENLLAAFGGKFDAQGRECALAANGLLVPYAALEQGREQLVALRMAISAAYIPS